MRRTLRLALLLLLCVLAAPSQAERERWILIDTERERLELRAGDEVVLAFPAISFGRGGVSRIHLAGDRTTPLGEFRITRVDDSDRFHLFIGLDYPTLEHVDAAHREALIDDAVYGELLDYALNNGGDFPHNSPLGGHIGIHGIGDGSPEFHRRFHWTEGCIAMTNAQVEDLSRLVDVGTAVVIR